MTKDFTTKSFNMWKTDELALYPQVTGESANPDCLGSGLGKSASGEYQEKVSFDQSEVFYSM